ncbi:MAG: PIN domain-containing protein [Nitrospirota bacterium]
MTDLPGFIIDTCSFYWYLSNSKRLSKNAQQIFVDADQGKVILVIPIIVLAELYYLLRKQNSPINFRSTISEIRQTMQYRIESHTIEDILAFEQLSVVTEMHDRLIVAMALRFRVPIVTCDPEIICSEVKTIW